MLGLTRSERDYDLSQLLASQLLDSHSYPVLYERNYTEQLFERATVLSWLGAITAESLRAETAIDIVAILRKLSPYVPLETTIEHFFVSSSTVVFSYCEEREE